jgi:hypothetical protein
MLETISVGLFWAYATLGKRVVKKMKTPEQREVRLNGLNASI